MNKSKKSGGYILHSCLILFILIIYILQYSIKSVPDIKGATALLLVPAVIAIAARFGEWMGFYYGLGIGLLIDSVSDSVFFNTVSLAILGFIVGLLISNLLNRNFYSVVILGLVGCLAFFCAKLIVFIIYGYTGALDYLFYHTIPSAIYSGLFCSPIYYLFAWIDNGFTIKKK